MLGKRVMLCIIVGLLAGGLAEAQAMTTVQVRGGFTYNLTTAARNPDGYGVIWWREDLRFAFYKNDGTRSIPDVVVMPDASLLESSGITKASYLRASSLQWTGEAFALAFTLTATSGSSRSAAFFATISPSGEVNVRNIATGKLDHPYAIELGWNGTELGLVWADMTLGKHQVLFLRLTRDGAPIGAPLSVSKRWTGGNYSFSPLVWNGERWAVLWRESNAVRGFWMARIPADGRGPLPALTLIRAHTYSVGLAWSGSEYGLAWYEWDDSAADYDMWFMRVSAEGKQIGDRLRLSNNPQRSVGTDIVWNGKEYGVLWLEYTKPLITARLARISLHDGKIAGVTLTVPAVTGKILPNPLLFWTGTRYAVVWESLAGGGK